MRDIVYHSGDFKHKAEDILSIDLGRHTGFFGTGYYFVKRKEKLDLSDYRDRPIYAMDVSRCNLLQGDKVAHRHLKTINGYLQMHPLMEMDFDSAREVADIIEDELPSYRHGDLIGYIKDSYEELTEDDPHYSFHEYMDDCFNGLVESLKRVGYWSFNRLAEALDRYTPDWEALDDIYESCRNISTREDVDYIENIHENTMDAFDYFGLSEHEGKDICWNIWYELNRYYGDGCLYYNSELRGQDSFPTRFLKALGYDGVYPEPECDNTTYGGCVFDLDKVDILGEVEL